MPRGRTFVPALIDLLNEMVCGAAVPSFAVVEVRVFDGDDSVCAWACARRS
jgi:hypothetical protein